MIGADQLTPVIWHSLWTVEGLVALGTFAVAAVTAFLAWRTSRMASKTADLAVATESVATRTGDLAESTERLAGLTETDVGLSRIAIEAAVRPVLIAAPLDEFLHPSARGSYHVRIPGRRDHLMDVDRARVWVSEDEDGWLLVSVPVRNEGAGIAFGLTGTLLWEDQAILGEITSYQVPPHEFSRVSFGIPPGGREPGFAAVASAGRVSIRVDYIDLAGIIWSTRLTLEPHNQDLIDWRVTDFWVTSRGRIERSADPSGDSGDVGRVGEHQAHNDAADPKQAHP